MIGGGILRNLVKRIDKILTQIEENLIFVLMLTMLFVVFIGIINRFILKESLPWAEELSRYLLIWSALVGASLGVKHSVHISIDAIANFLPPRLQRGIVVLSYIVSFSFCVTVLIIGIPFVLRLMETNQLSPAMRIPIYFAYASVPVGIFFMAIRYFCLTVYEFSSNRQAADKVETDKEVLAG